MRRHDVHIVTCLFVVELIAVTCASGQIVPIRTVPVASGDQFLILPSESLGMGGVRLAIDDSLADGWSNPAKGVLVRETAFLGSPTYYAISDGGGGGRTFPVAGLFAGSKWFGGAALALQQIENESRSDLVAWEPLIDFWEAPRRLSDAFARNLYASGFLGVRGPGGWSVGLGLSAATLDAMDGVDLLYADADRIEQWGGTQDIRLGLYRNGSTDRASLLLLHSRVSMTHEVTYVDWTWDPVLNGPVQESRLEKNEDRTRTWGLHLAWDRKLEAPGWRVGASVTVNRKSHPKIPDYEIQGIPRDPGRSWAYEAAFGFARQLEGTTFGMDVAFQPIWSETWQEADAQDVANASGALRIGDRTLENDFFFTNVFLRTGLSKNVGRTTLQAGLEVRSYEYSLEQVRYAPSSYREQNESWMEWTPTLGALVRFAHLDLRYSGRVTTGTGRPGSEWTSPGAFTELDRASAADFILAPRGPLTLRDANTMTHQISVRIPVR